MHPALNKLRRWTGVPIAVLTMGLGLAVPAGATTDYEATALQMAELLRAARSVVSNSQALINDPARGDKGLTGDKVLERAIAVYKQRTSHDPHRTDPASLGGELLRAQMRAIVEVMDAHQSTINAPDVGFKGFIPAVFARLVNEHVGKHKGHKAKIKVTAPRELVRNRKARPDSWEDGIIESRLRSPDWPRGKPYSETVDRDGKPAYRLLVPSYYTPSCLTCHGEPRGAMDITGYPKEGGKAGELGAVISVTLYR